MKNLLFSFLIVCSAAQAEFMDGNQLLNEIQSTEGFRRIYGMGYIAGVTDANMSITHCMPSNVSLGQVRDMTEQYLMANPSIRNLSADLLIAGMLTKRWPCQTQSRGRGT